MKKEYKHKNIENKWQKKWEIDGLYKTKDTTKKPKYYVLDMFPYPSGQGLHVGHPKGYIATDIYSRLKRMQGYNVLHPMGWDAFGLPAENYAIKNKIHPKVAVEKNIKRYKQQLKMIGFDYDWTREINTTDPDYYKWTQWIFLQLYKKGLAYQSYEPINWCPSCKTGLANEDLENGKCERCGSEVEQKPMRQWVLKITKYADRLLKDLDKVNWPQSIKESQKNWIGRSEGSLIDFPIINQEKYLPKKINIFTTRPDTIFGVTYLAISPELVKKWLDDGWQPSKLIIDFVNQELKNRLKISYQSEIIKSGIDSGLLVKNPASGENVPVWITNYVLGGVGTGAIMAVPAHDERDFEFAKKYNLSVKEVVSSDNQSTEVYTGPGLLINSGKFDGLNSDEAKKVITKFVDGKLTTTYKLKDWVFSRQRYWGEPIPIIHCEKCGVVPVPEKDLPVILPKVKSYEPSGTGESPLANIKQWVNTTCPKCRGEAKRETNTMPQWAGSSWYYLRYVDPENKKSLVSQTKEKYWQSVDMYVGGAEHATRHLIYARFWHKFLYDIGVVSTLEPFKKLQHVGLILGSDSRKMSKRWGNVVNPDDVIKLYGADSLRLYEMFMGPFDQEIAWNTDSMIGSRRFLEKVWRLQFKIKDKATLAKDVDILLNRTIKKIADDIEVFSFNTAISTIMILVNKIDSLNETNKDLYQKVLLLIAPFAPHITEEIWSNLGNKKSIHLESWPKYDSKKLINDSVLMIIQINGKTRGTLEVNRDISQSDLLTKVKQLENVSKWFEGKEIKKIIFVPNKIINLVI